MKEIKQSVIILKWSEQEGTSFTKVVSFAQNETVGLVLLIVIVILILIPTLILFFVFRYYRKKRLEIEEALKNGGGEVIGTIAEISKTGLTVNEKPQVLLEVIYSFEKEYYSDTIKMIASLFDPPQIGDELPLIFDPVKEKVYLPRG